MTPEKHEQIRIKLAAFLNRDPSEAEIINGQTDEKITGWIRDDEHAALKASIEKVAQVTKVDISTDIIATQ